jgi:hypothetical protein
VHVRLTFPRGKYFLVWSSKTKNAFSPRGPPVLPSSHPPCKSRSCGVANHRHDSFCELGCELAATLVTEEEVFQAAHDHVQSLRVFAAFGDDEVSLAFAGGDVQ